jgi:hypothetical protein
MWIIQKSDMAGDLQVGSFLNVVQAISREGCAIEPKNTCS